jgi:predicted glutamine amidotransferase
MCRLIAFHKKDLNRRQALQICLTMEGSNTDGVGSGHIENGELKIRKWPKSLTSILKSGKPFLEHLENPNFNGWTIVHLRAASIGEVSLANTHPFNIDKKWIFAHNGTLSSNENNMLRLAMSKTVKFEGETDSEVLGHLLNIGGAREFAETIKNSGVFLSLRKDGCLYAVKTSGMLDICSRNGLHFLASDIKFVDYPDAKTVSNSGWFYFDANGKLLSNKEIKSSYTSFGVGSSSSTVSSYRHAGWGMGD